MIWFCSPKAFLLTESQGGQLSVTSGPCAGLVQLPCAQLLLLSLSCGMDRTPHALAALGIECWTFPH
jgi:hypothetical protein